METDTKITGGEHRGDQTWYKAPQCQTDDRGEMRNYKDLGLRRRKVAAATNETGVTGHGRLKSDDTG